MVLIIVMFRFILQSIHLNLSLNLFQIQTPGCVLERDFWRRMWVDKDCSPCRLGRQLPVVLSHSLRSGYGEWWMVVRLESRFCWWCSPPGWLAGLMEEDGTTPSSLFLPHAVQRWRAKVLPHLKPCGDVSQDSCETHVVLWCNIGFIGKVFTLPPAEPDARAFLRANR